MIFLEIISSTEGVLGSMLSLGVVQHNQIYAENPPKNPSILKLLNLKPRSDRARRTRVDASNQTNVKDRKHSHRPRRLICIHRMSDVTLSYT